MVIMEQTDQQTILRTIRSPKSLLSSNIFVPYVKLLKMLPPSNDILFHLNHPNLNLQLKSSNVELPQPSHPQLLCLPELRLLINLSILNQLLSHLPLQSLQNPPKRPLRVSLPPLFPTPSQPQIRLKCLNLNPDPRDQNVANVVVVVVVLVPEIRFTPQQPISPLNLCLRPSSLDLKRFSLSPSLSRALQGAVTSQAIRKQHHLLSNLLLLNLHMTLKPRHPRKVVGVADVAGQPRPPSQAPLPPLNQSRVMIQAIILVGHPRSVAQRKQQARGDG